MCVALFFISYIPMRVYLYAVQTIHSKLQRSSTYSSSIVSKVRMTLALLKDVWVSINKWVLSEQLVNIVGNI